MEFGEPRVLWLLAIPALLLLLWGRQVAVRRRDARTLAARRQLPVLQRFPVIGPALFPLAVILAIALLVVALARPRVVTAFVQTGGADIVVLLDGSASMAVPDVPVNRWTRAVRFLRALGDSLSWERDRVALTLFAHIAAPQVRLTNDPNTYFFFLDYLERGSPFRLEDDTSWDTNIALGIEWGLRVIDKDEEIKGPSTNAKRFVLLTDGQAWSGVVEQSLNVVRSRGIPVWGVGVGTLRGGIIPDPKRIPAADPRRAPTPPPITRSSLDRASLRRIANTSGGQYLELDRQSDTDLANRIVEAARRRSGPASQEPQLQEVYWPFLIAAAGVMMAGLLFLRERTELVLQLTGGAIAVWLMFALT